MLCIYVYVLHLLYLIERGVAGWYTIFLGGWCEEFIWSTS